MPYLIDGHNLIPKVPGLSLESIDDEVELIQKLQVFCRQTGKNVEVYFDNAPAGQSGKRRYGRVQAHFVRAGRTADAAIMARLKSLGRGARNWTVVSSDREVAGAARDSQARVIDSGGFAELLDADDGVEGSADQGEAPDVALGEDEVDAWLDLFGDGED